MDATIAALEDSYGLLRATPYAGRASMIRI
jgi:hypothetical protein